MHLEDFVLEYVDVIVEIVRRQRPGNFGELGGDFHRAELLNLRVERFGAGKSKKHQPQSEMFHYLEYVQWGSKPSGRGTTGPSCAPGWIFRRALLSPPMTGASATRIRPMGDFVMP